ncbi:phosphotransferase KptA/Tpt1, partial [Kipferlia bialata]
SLNHPCIVSREELDTIVRESDKQRFSVITIGDTDIIRANQGHSIPVDLGLVPCTPPDTLYHGTIDRFHSSIAEQGLTKQSRHHVHLSESWDTAVQVGRRRQGGLVMLK